MGLNLAAVGFSAGLNGVAWAVMLWWAFDGPWWLAGIALVSLGFTLIAADAPDPDSDSDALEADDL